MLLLLSYVTLKEGIANYFAAKYSRFYLPLPSTFKKIVMQMVCAPHQ